MKMFAGMIVGFVVGVSVSAYAASCIGAGLATGWTVFKDGDEICTDPTIYTGSKAIDCG
jgi:hypothetical protein